MGRYLDEIRQDPMRSLRNLVDLGREAAGRPREGRFLYLLYRRYRTADDVEDITPGAWAERILPHAGMAALLISGLEGGAPEAAARYARDSWMEQRYPTLVFNFYSDFL